MKLCEFLTKPKETAKTIVSRPSPLGCGLGTRLRLYRLSQVETILWYERNLQMVII